MPQKRGRPKGKRLTADESEILLTWAEDYGGMDGDLRSGGIADLAAAVGCERSTLSKFIHGHQGMSAALWSLVLHRLALERQNWLALSRVASTETLREMTRVTVTESNRLAPAGRGRARVVNV